MKLIITVLFLAAYYIFILRCLEFRKKMEAKRNRGYEYFKKYHIRNILDRLLFLYLFLDENKERQECSFKNEYMCSYSCGACVFEEYYKINASQKWR